MKIHQLLFIGLALGTLATPSSSRAQDTNTVELIRQLQQRIEQLEQKVQSLEASKNRDEQAIQENASRRINELEQQLKTFQKERELTEQANESKQKAQVEALDQQVRILQRNRELDQEAAEAKAKETPKITVGDNGFGLASANGNFGIQFKGVLQVDSRTYFGDNVSGNDGFLLRRARPILQGTVFKDFDFLFVPDFGGSSPQIFDAYVNYRLTPGLQFQSGKFKSPIGLEQLQADVDTLFNERSLVTDLVPNRDLGFALHGDVLGGVFSYTAALLNGVGDYRNSNNSDSENSRALEGRIFIQPFKKSSSLLALQNFGFGLSGSHAVLQQTNVNALPSTTGGTLPGYTTDGQQQWFAYNPTNGVVVAKGQHWRLSPQGYYYYGPFGLMAEYAISDQEVSKTGPNPPTAFLHNTAWEVSGSWVLTGEDAGFKGGVIPRRPFNPFAGGWGALQFVARYAQLHIDDAAFPLFSNPLTSASDAAAWGVGLNWYLNRNLELKASFSHTEFTGGGGTGANPPAAVTRNPENVFFTRVQLGF